MTFTQLLAAVLDGRYGWQDEVLMILAFVLASNILAKWLLKVLHKRFERQGKAWQDSFVQALYTPLVVYAWFFALVTISNLLFPSIEEHSPSLIGRVLAAGAVLCFAWFIMRWKNRLIQISIHKSKRQQISWDPNKIDIIGKVGTVFVFFLTGLLLLEVTDRSVTTLLAFGGIGGLAVAFASQEVVSNFFSGIMLYATHPFSIGDWIRLPERGLEGNVEEIGWYMTQVRAFDKRPIYIPNSLFSKVLIETPSRMSHRQFKESFTLKYQDASKVGEVLERIKLMLHLNPALDQELGIAVYLTAFSQNGLKIEVSVYMSNTDGAFFAQVRQDILFKIMSILESCQMEMAFPPTVVDVVHPIRIRKDN